MAATHAGFHLPAGRIVILGREGQQAEALKLLELLELGDCLIVSHRIWAPWASLVVELSTGRRKAN